MKKSDFVHLHVHTQYSLLDGAIRLDRLFEKAKSFSMSAVSMTDHGNLFGTVDFYQQANRSGIKPIIGSELYVAPKSRKDRESYGIGESNRHLVVHAKDIEGYRNLVKLSSLSFLEGFYYRPRVDKEILAQYSEGLIATSACLHGEIASYILKGDKAAAYRSAEEYRNIFGEGNFYLEIMENGLPEQKVANDGLMELGRDLGIPLVATNDCHYLNREDAEAHDILLCIQTGKTIEDSDRMKLGTDQFYFRSPDEMISLFDYCPEAIENTIAIADRCNLTLSFDQFFLPQFKVEGDRSLEDHLRDITLHGWKKLHPTLGIKDEALLEQYENRISMELDIINSMGFAGYFLIVSDFVNQAKHMNVPVGPGRGSVAGSLVANALGITNIDPIRYGLFFERFLNPSRKSMPDIDIDFCIEGRNDIIKYVTEKYGTDRVAQIITFGTMQARGVIRDVGRALNMPYGEVDRIAKLVPAALGMTLDTAVDIEPRLKEEEKKSEKIGKLLSLSRKLEGLNRHSSTHAAGVVISDIPLMERVPLYKTQRDEIVTQYPMNDLQSLGLIKFDFLGLKTLTVIRDTLRFIKEGKGIDIEINRIPLDDKLTYQLLSKGETDGVFQLESSGMKEILVGLKPDCIEDVMALIALYRPGPMKMVPEFISRKQGKTKIVYEAPELEPILKETYGVILYQEQVMQIASAMAKYTMADADTFRKAMSKKKASEMEKERPKFVEGAQKNNIPEAVAKKIFEQMETFAGYGFNKSHSAAYAMISYQTAYLKAHYPVEFMAALLSSEKNNRDKIIKYSSDSRDMGISVLPPDINESSVDFSVSAGRIRFGLAAVKNVGVSAIESIIAAREIEGNFNSFIEFCNRVDLRKINKRVIESLIKCGAFDAFGHKRRQLMESFEKIIDAAQRNQKKINAQQAGLFESDPSPVLPKSSEELKEISEWENSELLAYEKEVLGFYISSHPLAPFAAKLRLMADTNSSSLQDRKDGDTVTFVGIVSGIREILTKRKDIMAYINMEDMKGSVSLIAFSDTYKSAHSLFHSDDPILIKGIVDAGEESSKIRVVEATSLKDILDNPYTSVHFQVKNDSIAPESLLELKQFLLEHRGKYDSYIHLTVDSFSETVIYLGKDMKLNISEEIRAGGDNILGRGSTKFI
jgi:DNA polymerase-3 subunit alpha